MRKNFIICAAAVALLLSSCQKKESDIVPDSPEHTKSHLKQMSATMPLTSVSSEGFRIFSSKNDLEAYVEFLSNATLAEIRTSHVNEGFHSLAGQDFSEVASGERLKEEHLALFLFNEQGIVQIEETLFKNIGKGQLMLTMPSKQAGTAIFTKFAAGNFDASFMNKFAPNGAAFASGKGILDIVGTTPSGINDFPGDTPPAQTMGWKNEYADSDTNNDGILDTRIWFRVYYIFGIPIYQSGKIDKVESI